jgi:transposase
MDQSLFCHQRKIRVRRWICGESPNSMVWPTWTRAIVRELIRERFDIDISISSVGVLLAELQITPQKPLQLEPTSVIKGDRRLEGHCLSKNKTGL